MVKLLNLIKFILRPISYGVLVAVVLILTVPELRSNLTQSQLFKQSEQQNKPLSYAKAVNRAAPAVVNIYSVEIEQNLRFGKQTGEINNLGSGVIMNDNGYILTNYHVVEKADQIVVLLQRGEQLDAQLIGYDIYTDLAVLKVNAINLPVIPKNPSLVSVVGDVVLAIGNPLNIGQTVTQGIISATGRNGLSSTNYSEFLQMDAAINEGNSGGALVNTNGELVGINSRVFNSSHPLWDVKGISLAIPYKLANKVMHKIIEHGQVTRGWLGIRTELSSSTGQIYVKSVSSGSPAERAGFQIYDVIAKINGVDITSIPQALDMVAETAPGKTLTFTLYRSGQQIELPVTIVKFRGIGK